MKNVFLKVMVTKRTDKLPKQFQVNQITLKILCARLSIALGDHTVYVTVISEDEIFTDRKNMITD